MDAQLNMVARPKRKHWIGMSLGLALVAWVLIGRAVLDHAGALSLVLGILAAVGFIASARVAIQLPVAFSVDERGFVLGRGKRFVPWHDVEEIRIARYQNEHNLILRIKPSARQGPRRFMTTNRTNPAQVEVNLDHISLDWRQVVANVEAASGMTVEAFKDGPFRLRSKPTGGE
jgi:hypothetical protein